MSVNAAPAAITGTMSVCMGATTPLGDPTGGGAWGSGTAGIATVTPAGVVSGVAAGTDTISYTHGGCAAYAIVTVNTAPANITGTTNVCAGATTSFSDATGGGTWASSSGLIATVGSCGRRER